ncbi:carboxypeptidase M32 [Tritonibacter scottomollicae]|uniref:Metal-dependent carboxypeptidase n=1 Tax=Tritonibacter scottomollicae TaxID=483013 RepID=A0ABZ0HJG8_TRISK|nr:carboxypeptidase M32 [Tritonibacter scottomollicae]WOI34149.1 carboxypeptidase M32 [Tritonibacter scottomollicae]
MSSFDELIAFERETQALGQIAGRLGWDQETMMPRGAAPQRGEEMAAIEAVLHARRSDPRVAEWLETAKAPDETGAAQLREIRRAFERAVKVPGDLASRIARVTSEAQGKWAQARADEDVAAFLPVLEEVVALKRQEGQALAAGGNLYDAMVADYEQGTTSEDIAKIFDAMRPGLVDLRARVLEKPTPDGVSGSFDENTQMKLARKIAKTFGYDMSHGRVDKAVHPFSSGSGLDVRITTRTNPQDPFNCIYSTIHEVGHGAYEQNIGREHLLTALGRGVSMGVHESQSRIYENQLGRSRAFTGWLFKEMREAFGHIGISSAEAFYAAVNRVQNGYIRTEADELQYNLHIMLRFDLERALMSGDLEVQDLEAAWNDRFLADFGYPVDKPSNGCLQDVHWSVGLFGYFPTYSLGNVYAGCLHEALRQDVTDLDAQLAQGDTVAATGWLREKLQQFGGLREPQDTIIHAAGAAPTHEPLMAYLEAKFSEIYNL